MNKYYLVKKTKSFFDRRGVEEEGATTITIETDEFYGRVDEEAFYDSGYEVIDEECLVEEDRYHRTAYYYQVREINEQAIKSTQQLLNSYNAL